MPGEGSKFTIALPLQAEEKAQAAAKST